MSLWFRAVVLWMAVAVGRVAGGQVVASATQYHWPLEPSFEQAVTRWPDMERPIAFLGCKDHPDEFAVMWNGNLSMFTNTDRTHADRVTFRERANLGLQVSFAAGEKPDFQGRDVEDGTTQPGLLDGYLPIVEITIRRAGAVLRQEAFATDERGSCLARAWNSPVFLRVRFTVVEPGAGGSPVRLWAQLAKNHVRYRNDTKANIRILPTAPLYGQKLRADGQQLVDPEGRIVMYASQGFRFHPQLADALNSVALREFQLDKNLVELSLARQAGAAIELVFPFLPAQREQMAPVLRVGHDQARQSLRKCWSDEIGRGMQVQLPEAHLNNLWRFNVPLTFIVADSYPNGDRVFKLSPHHYEAYWPTPMTEGLQELGQRGYFHEVAAYLEPFLDADRRRPVPNTGRSFMTTKGFISGPTEHLDFCWLSDNGAILWAVAEYYLLSRDEAYLKRWLPSLLASLEWIARERQNTRLKGGLDAGLLPAGRASDVSLTAPGVRSEQANYVWSDAWNYRGLATVTKVLERIKHPDAPRWARERDDYRATFQKTFRQVTRKTIRWVDPSGQEIPLVPWELEQTNADSLHWFYLDSGPLVLGLMGLVDPDDELMTWTLKWFTEGPDSDTHFPNWSRFRDRPSLRYEMASAEIGCSWNVYLRFLRNERLRFLEGFYSLVAGGVSRKVLNGFEHRNAVQGMSIVNSIMNNHLRNMLVFEDEAAPGLHLLRNSPSTWLRPGQRVQVDRAETYFGRVSYRVEAIAEDRIEAVIEAPSREPPEWLRLYLYHPRYKPLRVVTVNGQTVMPSAKETVEITRPSGTLKVVAQF